MAFLLLQNTTRAEYIHGVRVTLTLINSIKVILANAVAKIG